MTVGPADREHDRRIAWVAGATGRLGDALVEQVLASGRYHRVSVLAARAMATTVTGFEAVDLATLRQRLAGAADQRWRRDDPADPARCDDLYLLLDPDALRAIEAAARQAARPGPAHPPFEPLTDSESALAIASLATQAGAQRLLLLAPLQSWQQLSRATRILPDGLELKLAALRIPLVIVMKPSGEALPDADPQTPAPAPRTGWRQRLHHRIQRFSRFYLRQLRFMLPASSVVIRSVDLARIAVERVTGPDDRGLRIIGIEWIEDHLREKRGMRPRGAERRNGWRPQR